ncbi:MAG: DUF1549 domain-containing protein, partial [Planctomycetota bacterium]
MRTTLNPYRVGLYVIVCVVALMASTTFGQTSFRNDVLPVLSKVGCNSGACHGAIAGKGGFRLSLRGYNPESDYFNIVKQARGRRIEPVDPGRSLLITKPTATVPHKGGLKFEVGSEEYKILTEWIRTGASAPTAADPVAERIEIQPDSSIVENGKSLELTVIAHFSDGSARDITQWAKFSSTNETVARVDDTGKVSVIGYGEGAITAWYSSKIGVARVTSPWPNDIANEKYATADRVNFIDDLVLKQLKRLNLSPSAAANEAAFVRRAFLDTIGTLPTAAEISEYVKDDSADRKAKLVDRLLARPEYVDYWTYKWSDLLLINGTRLRPAAVESFYKWVRGQIESNRPWDEFVREIITSKGGSVEHGATNFYALHQTPEEMAE